MVRLHLPRVAVVLVLASLVTYTFFVAPRLGSVGGSGVAAAGGPGAPGASASPPAREVFPRANDAFLGITTAEGRHDFSSLDAFATATKRKPAVMMFSEGWAVDHFDAAAFEQVTGRGMMPLLSWEPWDYRVPPQADNSRSAQPKYALSRIINGEFDSYIKSYADGIHDLGYQVGIRFAHEMNGFWYPWSEQSNGNHPGEYVKMWRHVHDIFTKAGATNVLWVWSANVSYSSSLNLSSLYPGDDYVDWLGLSGYYGTQGTENYRGFETTFAHTMTELRTFSHKPLVLTEVGATDSAGRKADWIRELFASLPHHPDIIGVIWFEAVRETDWRIANAPAAAAAWAAGAAEPRYSAIWTRNSIGRLEATFPAVAGSPSPSVRSTIPGRTPTPRVTSTKTRLPSLPATTPPPTTPPPPPTTTPAEPTTPVP